MYDLPADRVSVHRRELTTASVGVVGTDPGGRGSDLRIPLSLPGHRVIKDRYGLLDARVPVRNGCPPSSLRADSLKMVQENSA